MAPHRASNGKTSKTVLKPDTLLGRNVRIDVVSLAFIAIAFVIAGWFLLNNLQTKYLEGSTADALKVDLFIESELAKAKGALLLFGKVKEEQRSQVAAQMYESFSDLYRLSHRGQVESIYKAVPNSRVFDNFSFTSGPVRTQLLGKDQRLVASSIVRGYEDALPSVYIMYRGWDEQILGRVTLDYLRKFIEQYDEVTGNLLLVTSQEGVVMVSGKSDVSIPSIDIAKWSRMQPGDGVLQTQKGNWIPVVKKSNVLGAWLVVLIPTTVIDTQRNIVLLTLTFGLLTVIGVFILKTHQTRRNVLAPLDALLARMRAVETGQPQPANQRSREQLREFAELEERFAEMAQAIEQREGDLASANHLIRERESELRRILKRMPIPVILFKQKVPSEVVFTNDAFSDALGYQLSDFVTLEDLFLKVCASTDAALETTSGLLKSIQSGNSEGLNGEPLETVLSSKTGTRHDIIMSAIRLGDTAIATLVDVTRLRQSERELLKAKLKAEEQERQKTEFFAMMNHEIRTPLTSIMGITQLLQHENLSVSQHDLVSRLSSANHFMLRIINDILDHSKLEAGELRFERLPFRIDTLLKTCQTQFLALAEQRGIELRVSLDSNCPVTWSGDAFRIEQILSNLVSNAIKFTERGSVAVEVCAAAIPDGQTALRFDIHDTGVGMSAEALSQVFTPFWQSDEGVARRFGGTGLGLYISKRLVALMQGEIGVDSQPGKGSHFWFYLPLAVSLETAQPPLAVDGSEPLPTQQSLQGKNLLVAEDSISIQRLLGEFLGSLGASVTVADDGKQALAILDQDRDRFDAVVMDLHMPVMDGIACTQQIRARADLADLPILIITAGFMDRQRQQALSAGANDVIEKPIDFGLLADWLIKAVATDAMDTLPEVAGIDRDHVAQTLGGNSARFARLFEVFLQETNRLVEAILQAHAQNDRQNALRQLHTLRGNAAQMGALSLRDVARTLEEGLERNEHNLDDRLKRLVRELETLNQAEACNASHTAETSSTQS